MVTQWLMQFVFYLSIIKWLLLLFPFVFFMGNFCTQSWWWNMSFHFLPPESTLHEGIRQHDSSDTGHSDNVNIAAEHQEPAEVLFQLDNTSNSPVYGEYKCC